MAILSVERGKTIAIAGIMTVLVGLSAAIAAPSPATPAAGGSPTPGASPAASPSVATPAPAAGGDQVVITTGKVDLVIDDAGIAPRHFEVAAGHDRHLWVTNSGSLAHTFSIDKLDVEVEIKPGETRTVAIETPRLGEYDYQVDGASGRDSSGTGTFTIYI